MRTLELAESISLNPSRSFPDDLSTFAHLEPFIQDHILPSNILDPALAWPDSIGEWSNAGQSLPIEISSPPSTPSSVSADWPVSVRPGESDKARHVRQAANQLHSKASQAGEDSLQNGNKATHCVDEQKQWYREKNKVAAAKCRLRQRKQVQTLQGKENRLGEKNAKLKTMIRELRGELNALRSLALDHQACDFRLAQYNSKQAEKVIAEYSSSRLDPDLGGYTFHSGTASPPGQRYMVDVEVCSIASVKENDLIAL